ncbi:carbohydrate-binding domain-containing protein [Anaeromicropila populeti]|nr:carbohydrate-binding domain-containing protein [Anaeromicropila populeti]
MRIKKKLMIIVCVLSFLLTACGTNGTVSQQSETQVEMTTKSTDTTDTAEETEGSGVTETSSSDTAAVSIPEVSFDDEDLEESWEEAAQSIVLNKTEIEFAGTGAVVEGTTIIIQSAGTYVITGELTDGQIIVDCDETENVHLILNGASITCSNQAPIYIKQAEKTIITVAAGTDNTVEDGTTFDLENEEENVPNAAIYSKDDLTINGTGTLNVTANYNNGINCKDKLKIVNASINLTSVDDGIIGKDYVAVQNGNIVLNTGGDALKSTNAEDAALGFVYIENGTYAITAGTDGIQAETIVYVKDGDFNITTGGGSVNSSKSAESEQGGWGRWQEESVETSTETTTEETTQSAKAVKAEISIVFENGKVVIDSSDDAIHSGNRIDIQNGAFEISSGDDGIHADDTLNIQNGTVNIIKSYEGLESLYMNIYSGDISITASDDGINVAGGADSSSVSGRPGQNEFSSSGNGILHIYNGSIAVDASGDGLDANGGILMDGGTVIVNGPTNDGNGAIDYDSGFELNGGVLIAAGSSGMAQNVSASESQGSILMTFSTQQSAGTVVSLLDEEGKEIVTFTPAKVFSSIVISTPDISIGSIYKIGTNGSEVVQFTLSESITYVNESGITTGNQEGFGNGEISRKQS